MTVPPFWARATENMVVLFPDTGKTTREAGIKGKDLEVSYSVHKSEMSIGSPREVK